jgi:hypothetical protein
MKSKSQTEIRINSKARDEDAGRNSNAREEDTRRNAKSGDD